MRQNDRTMKDISLAAFAVVALALAIGLVFFAVYPRVEPSAELAGLFVFLAWVLRWAGARLWSLVRKRQPGDGAQS
jgi:ABC-type protease/lipase transport system fused ATPase/permease subunit